MATPSQNSHLSNPEIQRDGNNQEYVETCNQWVRATLVMFEGRPHVRIQEHHTAEGGRLHLGPLVPLGHWSGFKESVDKLVGPYIRTPQAPLSRRTQSGALEYAILEAIALIQERRRQNTIGGWAVLVRDRVPEPVVNPDLEFAFKRLSNRGILHLTKPRPGAQPYTANDHAFFYTGPFDAEITPEGWAYWESLKG